MTEEEGKKAIYHLFDAVFREYRDYGGSLFDVGKSYVKEKEEAFINDKVVLDITFKIFLGKPAIPLAEMLRSF